MNPVLRLLELKATELIRHFFRLQVGDPQEVNGIVGVFCQSEREPLLIGSTKSNMGHPEPASGLAALAKVKRELLVICFLLMCIGLGDIIKQASTS